MTSCSITKSQSAEDAEGRTPMSERLKELIYETAVVTGGMAPIAILALALLS
jgi:hypothetical protein